MEENVETKKNMLLENLIGILLIMPIYMLVFIVINLLGLNCDGNIVLPITIYLPVIIGMVLINMIYKDKMSEEVNFFAVIFLGIAIFAWCMNAFIEWDGFDGLWVIVIWILSTIALKICACFNYGRIVGWKKTKIFFSVYMVLLMLSLMLGFWA